MLDSISTSGIRNCLDIVADCLAQAFPEGHPALSALSALHARLDQGRLQIAILGQFKRGKSTFINALLRAPFLPSAVVPATAIPTFIAWGSTPQIHVTFQDDRPVEEISRPDASTICEELRQWVTEECNPLNCRGVRRVELFVPAEVLRSGIVLIDTPGVGSTLRHNTDAALDALPECDTALFVVSADPPITAAEMAYLGAAQSHVVRLYFVLNKIDYLNDHERQDESLRQEAGRNFAVLVQRHIEQNRGHTDRAVIQRSLDSALPEFFETKLKESAGAFRDLVESMSRRHQQRADALIASVRHTTASLFNVALPPQEPLEPFHLGPEPYWVSQKLVHALIPSPGGIPRRLVPGPIRHSCLRRELEEEIAGLVLENVESLRWATPRGLDDSFRRFSMHLDERLVEAMTATEGSIQRVLSHRQKGADDAAEELQRLRLLENRLLAISSGLVGRCSAITSS